MECISEPEFFESMKTRSIYRHRGGFTLIELLVVIAIIAVLASAGFGVGLKMQNAARKKVGESAARGIVTAVDSFYSDNSGMPIPVGTTATDGGTKFDTSTVNGLKVLNILTGFDDEINTKKINYLNIPDAKGKKGGIIYKTNTKEVDGLFDPWGNPYIIVLDTDYAERLEFKRNNTMEQLNGRRCAVFSAGQDKKLGTADDVKSW